MLKPRKPEFNVTAKGLSLDDDHLSSLARPFFLIFAVLFVGAGTAFYRYWVEPGAELMLIVGLWTTFNLIIAGAALGVVCERREPDRFPRLTIDRRGLLTIGGETAPVTIHSVSAGGCALRFAEASPVALMPTETTLCTLAVLPLDGMDTHAPMAIDLVHVTAGTDSTAYGFSFAAMTPQSHLALADLMYGDPDAILRFLTSRRAHKNLFAGSWQFVSWGVLEPMRASGYVARAAKSMLVARRAKVVAAAEVAIASVAIEVAAPRDLEAVTITPVVVDIVAAIEPVVTETAFDFDSLAVELTDATTSEMHDMTADWMTALLTLAAAEMKRVHMQEEQADAPATVAA